MAERAENIGIWFKILEMLAQLAVISNVSSMMVIVMVMGTVMMGLVMMVMMVRVMMVAMVMVMVVSTVRRIFVGISH